MSLAFSICVLFVPLMQSVNGAQFLNTTFLLTLFGLCSTYIYIQNFCNQYNIYLYTIGTIVQHVFLFCATLNIFSQHESLFWV